MGKVAMFGPYFASSLPPISLVSSSFYMERNWIKLQNGFVDLVQPEALYILVCHFLF